MAPSERSEEARKRPVERSGTSCYLVTIKRNAIEFTRLSWLDAQLKTLKDKLTGVDWSDQVAYELDSLNRLHLHTVAFSKKTVYYKNLMRKGWHIHFQPFQRKDLGKVYSYINKHNQNKYRIEQLEDESYIYQLDDPFVDTDSDTMGTPL